MPEVQTNDNKAWDRRRPVLPLDRGPSPEPRAPSLIVYPGSQVVLSRPNMPTEALREYEAALTTIHLPIVAGR
jgi:hypothetical protein